MSRAAASTALALAVLLALVAWSLTVGQYPVAAADALRALWASLAGAPSGLDPQVDAVVREVRAPRIVAALLVGASLAGAGAAYQGLFRNPLVSPDILGVSAGCALGAGLAVMGGASGPAVQAIAFAGGLAAVALVVAVGSWVRGPDPLLTLVLTGVVVGSLFGAAMALVKLLADPYNQLPAITFWLLGSFANVTREQVPAALLPLAVGFAPLVLLRWRLDALALSDDEAVSLGVDAARLRLAVIVSATLVTATAVTLAGAIGWVGLVVPHAARMLVGPPFARVLPLAAALGAGFMLVVDTACRALFASEIPPGVATAFIGTPAFVALLALAMRRAP